VSTNRPLPLSIGNALDVAIRIVVRRFVPLVKAVFFVVAPFALVSSIVEVWVLPDTLLSPDDSASASEVLDALRSALGGLAVVGLIGAVGGLLASAACFRIVVAACLGCEVEWLDSIRYALARLPAILWVALLAGAAIVVGLALCLVPGLWLAVTFSVAMPVLLTEGLRGGAALGRSRALVRGRFWSVVGLLALGVVIAGAISIGVASIGDAVDPTTSTGFVVTWATGTIGDTLATPIMAAITTVMYLELRVRKEQLSFAELGEHLGLEPRSQAVWPEGPVVLDRTDEPERPPTAPGDPPFWPPPPGWQPPASAASPQGAPPADDEGDQQASDSEGR